MLCSECKSPMEMIGESVDPKLGRCVTYQCVASGDHAPKTYPKAKRGGEPVVEEPPEDTTSVTVTGSVGAAVEATGYSDLAANIEGLRAEIQALREALKARGLLKQKPGRPRRAGLAGFVPLPLPLPQVPEV